MRHIVHRKEENMNYYNEIKNELINNEINRKVKNYSINKSDLNTYYNVGKLLLDAGNQYGEGIIKEYSLKLTEELGLGYSQRNLRNMRQFYKVSQKWQTLSAKLSWSHYCEILWFDDNKFQYYVKIAELNNLSIRQLREKIKYEIAEELGLKDKVDAFGWGGLTAEETGRIGGIMTKRKKQIIPPPTKGVELRLYMPCSQLFLRP